MNADHTLGDEFRTRDRVRAHVVERILAEGLALVDDLQGRCESFEILENLLLDLHASTQDHRSFESWCHQDTPLALDSVRPDLKPHPVGLEAARGLGPGGLAVLTDDLTLVPTRPHP